MVKTIDQLIDETTVSLNRRISDKEIADTDAVLLKDRLSKFKQLKIDMENDPDYAACITFV